MWYDAGMKPLQQCLTLLLTAGLPFSVCASLALTVPPQTAHAAEIRMVEAPMSPVQFSSGACETVFEATEVRSTDSGSGCQDDEACLQGGSHQLTERFSVSALPDMDPPDVSFYRVSEEKDILRGSVFSYARAGPLHAQAVYDSYLISQRE